MQDGPLSAQDLAGRLATRVMGRPLLEIFPQIDSTQARAGTLALEGAEEGTLVLAEEQTSGRGRLGRSWHSPPGAGLWFSIVLRPTLDVDEIPLITLAAGLGAATAAGRMAGVDVAVKWPNDLLIGDRKLAGLLTQFSLSGPGSPFAVFGLGMNVNLDPGCFPADLGDRAVSLSMAAGRRLDRIDLLAEILLGIETEYDRLAAYGPGALLERYRPVCSTIGRRVEARDENGLVQGMAVDVDHQGRLVVVRDRDGERIALNGGEVTLRGKGK